jgi:hypothetical protein
MTLKIKKVDGCRNRLLADEEMKERWRRRVGGGICSKRKAGGDLKGVGSKPGGLSALSL